MVYYLRGIATIERDPMYRNDPFSTNELTKKVLTQDELVESLVRWNNLERQITSLQILNEDSVTTQPTGRLALGVGVQVPAWNPPNRK